jgi:ubiquinone/menaquinone biosynthesis C-methylase UbiE
MPSSRSTRIEKARTLLRPGVPWGEAGAWADLGCGDGIFTAALSSLLGPGSAIYAVDKSRRSLRALTRQFAEHDPKAHISAVRADFTGTLALPPLDGVVMANSLHFVAQKRPVLASVAALLKPAGRLIVVEYNTNRGNYAVPHPLDEHSFVQLARTAGLCRPRIISHIPSTFLGEMYAGMALAPGESSLPADHGTGE